MIVDAEHAQFVIRVNGNICHALPLGIELVEVAPFVPPISIEFVIAPQLVMAHA
jgi:hypothetical protein